jgi:HEAT repeat protein
MLFHKLSLLLLLFSFFGILPVSADEVRLKSGPRFVGKIIENTPERVVIRVRDLGDVTFRHSEVSKIVKTFIEEPPPKDPDPPPTPAPKTPDAPKDPTPPATPKDPAPPDAPAPLAGGTPVEALLNKLAAAKPEEQQPLLEELRKLAPTAAPEMVDLLEKVDAAQTGWLINALTAAPAKSTLKLLLAKTKAEKPSARAAVATLLGVHGKRLEGGPIKIKQEAPPKPEKGEAPAEAAKPPAEEASAGAPETPEEPSGPSEEVDERARVALRAFLADKEPSVRAAAFASLAALYDTDSAGAMVEAQADRDPAVRSQALSALENLLPRIEDKAWIAPRLVEILQGTGVVETKRAVVQAMSRIAGRVPMEDEGISDAVIELITHDNKDLRAEALTAIGRIAPKKAVALLSERMSFEVEPDPWARTQITNALMRSGDPNAVPALIDALEKDPVDTVRDASQRALQTITKQYYGGNVEKWRNWWAQFHPPTPEGGSTQ